MLDRNDDPMPDRNGTPTPCSDDTNGADPDNVPTRPGIPPLMPRTFLGRVQAHWKALAFIAVMVGAGAGATAYLARYATADHVERELGAHQARPHAATQATTDNHEVRIVRLEAGETYQAEQLRWLSETVYRMALLGGVRVEPPPAAQP